MVSPGIKNVWAARIDQSLVLSPGIKLCGQLELINPRSLNLRVLSPEIKLYGQVKLIRPRSLNLRVLLSGIKLYEQLELIKS